MARSSRLLSLGFRAQRSSGQADGRLRRPADDLGLEARAEGEGPPEGVRTWVEREQVAGAGGLRAPLCRLPRTSISGPFLGL